MIDQSLLDGLGIGCPTSNDRFEFLMRTPELLGDAGLEAAEQAVLTHSDETAAMPLGLTRLTRNLLRECRERIRETLEEFSPPDRVALEFMQSMLRAESPQDLLAIVVAAGKGCAKVELRRAYNAVLAVSPDGSTRLDRLKAIREVAQLERR